MLKTIGILAWGGCLLTLAYQGIFWVIYKSWPSISLMDILRSVFDLNILTTVENLPVDIIVKASYVAFTTQFSLFLWWTGVIMFGLMFTFGLLRK
jgi:hypothetical protein